MPPHRGLEAGLPGHEARGAWVFGLRRGAGTNRALHDGHHLVLLEVGGERDVGIRAALAPLRNLAAGEAARDELGCANAVARPTAAALHQQRRRRWRARPQDRRQVAPPQVQLSAGKPAARHQE